MIISPVMTFCGVREGTDKVLLELNYFSWFRRRFCTIIKKLKWSFIYHFTKVAER